MIYFGWAGYGPWHTLSGMIWFLAGILFTYLFSMTWTMVEDRRKVAQWWWIAAFLFLMMGCSAAVAGYYAWFGGVRAQFGSMQKDLSFEYYRGFSDGKKHGHR